MRFDNLRPGDNLEDEDTPPGIAWSGGIAVTAGILLALAIAQSAV